MSDLLDRVFGPDPNPPGPMPPHFCGYAAAGPHVHTWTERMAAGIQYWECTTNVNTCRATTVIPPGEIAG